METSLIEKRDEITKRLWAVEDASGSGEGPDVVEAAKQAAEELGPVAAEIGAHADPLEAGKTWKYLGDALYAASGREDQASLRKAREAYMTGEPLLDAAGKSEEIAKLNFNLANTLALIDKGQNLTLMQEAKERYGKTLLLFKECNHPGVPSAERSLQRVESQLQAHGVLADMEQANEEGQRLKDRLAAAGSREDAALDAEAAAYLGAQDPAAELRGFKALVDRIGVLLGAIQEDSERERRIGEPDLERDFAARDVELGALIEKLPDDERAEDLDVVQLRKFLDVLTDKESPEGAALRREFERVAAIRADDAEGAKARAKRLRKLIASHSAR